MRRYSRDEEERIRAQGLVREWTRSGLLDAAQGARLGADLAVELKRTNPFLRGGLALFTMLIVAATVALLGISLGLNGKGAVAALTGVSAVGCLVLADYLVGTYRCYRFGIEEALAVAAVVLLAISGAELTSSVWSSVAPWLIGAAGGAGLYRRFGFVYAALGAVVCAAAVPFQIDLPAAMQRLLAAAVIGSVFLAARSPRLRDRDDYPGDEYGIVQAAALAGVYGVLNVQLSPGQYIVAGWFYWATYLVTWVLPIVGLRLGILDKDRELMDVSLVLALVTLLTNKLYLGWARHTWDASLLGIALMAIALAVRKWLSDGPAGERAGFTPARLLEKDRAALSMLGVASAIVPPHAAPGSVPPRTEPPATEFGGGRSGGAGGGGTF